VAVPTIVTMVPLHARAVHRAATASAAERPVQTLGLDQMPARGTRVDGDTFMALIAGAVAGVAAFTLGSGFLSAASLAISVGGLAYGGLALRSHLRKNR
jgi:hypothetical protein